MEQLKLEDIILSPMPLVTISNEIQKDGAGQPIGATTNITLKGEIFPSGSGLVGSSKYTSGLFNLSLRSGSDSLRQQLNNLFKDSTPINLTLPCEFGSFSNCYIKKYSVDENENRWTTTIPYSIDLVYERDEPLKNLYLVNSTKDNWTIEPVEDYWITNDAKGATAEDNAPGYRITRSISAVGKYYPGKTPVENARQWVRDKSVNITGVIDSGLILFNHVRRTSVNKFDGSYGFDDTWLAFYRLTDTKRYAIENFEVEVGIDESKNITANVKGSVQGLEFFDKSNTGIPDYEKPNFNNANFAPTTGRFANALKTYIDIRNEIRSRAEALAGASLNPKPLSIVEGFDSTAGTITYSFSYDTRPRTIIKKAISESINVDTNYGQKELYASIFVIGRKLGPILQTINNSPSYSTTTVNYECVLPSSGMANLMFPKDVYDNLETQIKTFGPDNFLAVTNSGFSWNMNENRLSMTIEYMHS